MIKNLGKTKKKKIKKNKYFKKRSRKKGGLPGDAYTQGELNHGYVEGNDQNHCTYLTSPTGTYSHATFVDNETGFRYHYGYQKRGNHFEGPKYWSLPNNAPLYNYVIPTLLATWEVCRNQ